MAANAGIIVDDIQDWVIDSDIADASIWGLMDEVIDDIMGKHDPWFCFNANAVSKTAANHMNDSDLIPPAYEGGVLAVDADIVSGATVPDNSEYLQAILLPDGLKKPLKVYYGYPPSGDDELLYVGWEEFMDRFPHNTDGGDVNAPGQYTLYNGTILVGATPPLAFSLTIYGVYRPSLITANADTSEWITNADSLLKYGVMRKLILYNYEEDSGRWNAINREYRQAKNALISHSRHRTIRAHRPKSRRAGTRRT
jgi:hypothetical protein